MLRGYRKAMPRVDPTAYVAEGAFVIGDVSVGPRSSVWFGAVLRGDINRIEIGEETNVQDNCVLHVGDAFPCIVKDRVTIGHSAVVHGCTIEEGCLIGAKAVILNGARVGRGSIVAAGALVPEGMVVPPGVLVMGCPARVKRDLTEEELASTGIWAPKYARVAAAYRGEGSEGPRGGCLPRPGDV